jgi:YbbR domain-containing protein
VFLVRWLARNLGTLVVAFLLAVLVWVSAGSAADPIEQRVLRSIPLEKEGQAPGLLIVGANPPNTVSVTMSAPRSIWNQLQNQPDLVHAWIDLSGVGRGEHNLPVQYEVGIRPVRVLLIEPASVHLTLEPLVTKKVPVELVTNGDPPLGYRYGQAEVEPMEVTVSGPASAMANVSGARTQMNVAGLRETKRTTGNIEVINANGDPVANVTVTPRTVNLTQPVSLEGGFKNVVVRVVTEGQPASGYRLTNISVTPLNVTVFSPNPQLFDDIPGFVETNPINLTGLVDDMEVRVDVILPEGVTLVGEQSVLVQVGIAAIEGSLTMSLPVETIGLPPGLVANLSPETVNLIVSGPLPVLDMLTPDSFRVVVDLSGRELGIHQIEPVVDLKPDTVQVNAPQPDTVQVTILVAPSPTPSPTGLLTPAPTGGLPTPSPAPTATPSPN